MNCWLNASAGTGKTKVLIDRFVRLLLSGCSPEAILCLTFTNAAAAEMQQRLLQKIQSWAIKDFFQVEQELFDLLGTFPTSEQVEKAQNIFFAILDTPSGLKIQTIHSFCQSLLQQFPLEAGIDPCFRLIKEEDSAELLKQSQKEVLENLPEHLKASLEILTSELSETAFDSLLQSLQARRSQFYYFLNRYKNLQHYEELLRQKFLKDPLSFPLFNNTHMVKVLCEHGNLNDQKIALSLKSFSADLSKCRDIFLTKEGTIRKRIISRQLEIDFPEIEENIKAIACYLYSLENYKKSNDTIELTLAFCEIAQEVFRVYQCYKKNQSGLDFEDLINLSCHLLRDAEASSWVVYKLSSTLEHILIDEAQDTSIAQWDLLKELILSFVIPDFSRRTLFVVGDIKQSIYSFQGADPSLFLNLPLFFQDHFLAQGQKWQNINLQYSYRSTPAILKVVDLVFEAFPQGVQFDQKTVKHFSSRLDDSGKVEIWPLIEKESPESTEEWPLPVTQKIYTSLDAQLACQIAEKIEKILESKEILSSTKTAVQPKDILILMGRRAEWVPLLLQELKQRNIPVAGVDRLFLKDHIAILDLLALGRFLCLPQDDYSLACVLKSPLINKGYGFSEEMLFEVCHNRESSLWESLLQRQAHNKVVSETVEFLKKYLSKVDYQDPFSLFHSILRETESAFVARLGAECKEILQEFLQQILHYQQFKIASLQGLIQFMDQQKISVKRSSLSLENQVRLMTIHGSKGLQAPVVILVDSGDYPTLKNDSFLWQEGKEPLFIVKPSQKDETEDMRSLKEASLERTIQEQRRLLYVALTRAQDNLYIAGLAKRSKSGEWYALLLNTLQKVGEETTEGGWVYKL